MSEQWLSLAVIIPARNEEGAVASVVGEVFAALSGMEGVVDFEVVVVDDASSDRTAVQAQEAGARVIVLEEPSGYGWAVKRGIAETTAEVVCLLDADGSYPGAALPGLLSALAEGRDQVIGARVAPGAKIPWVRRPAKWVIRKLAEALLGKRVPDLNSGMRVFRRSRVLPILRVLPDGFSLSTSLTVAALLDGWRVAWLPVEYRTRIGRSKFRAVYDTARLLLSLIRAVVYFDPLRVFLPLCFLLGSLAVAFGLWDVFYERNLTDKTVLTSLSALEIFVLGLLADLLVKRRS
ncbi:MAG: glycosyltransferase family 2 protein [Thermoanaerobaculum sp.]